MTYQNLDRDEYRNIPMYRIEANQNGFPFFIARTTRCNARPHRHEFVQIVYISKGKLKHVLNHKVFDVIRGDIFIIPPYVPHYFIDSSAEKYEIVEFEFIPEFIDERFALDYAGSSFLDFTYLEPFLVVEKEIRPRLNLTGNLQQEVENILAEISREYELREPDFQLMIRAMLLKLLVLVSREFRKSLGSSEAQSLFDRHRDALGQAIDYIKRCYTQPVSVEEAARVAMLSQSYFRSLFRQMFRKSFVEYVNGLRVAKACELIRSRPDLRIIDICHESGFNNVNYFNRLFHEATGLSPLAYRKAAGSVAGPEPKGSSRR